MNSLTHPCTKKMQHDTYKNPFPLCNPIPTHLKTEPSLHYPSVTVYYHRYAPWHHDETLKNTASTKAAAPTDARARGLTNSRVDGR